MDDFREEVFSDNVLAQLGTSIVQLAPKPVKEAVFSLFDTIRWMLAEEPTARAMERTLDLEVIRALQEKYESTNQQASVPSSHLRETSTRRCASQHVRWSPICKTIYSDGEIENAPLRPCVETKNPLSPLAL